MLTSMLAIAAALVAAPQSGSARPPVTPTVVPTPLAPPPRPPVTTSRVDHEAAQVRARVAEPVHVRVSAGSELLWEGQLLVSGISEGSFSQNRTDANDGSSCPNRFRESRRTSLSVRLQRASYSETLDAFSLNSSWERPILDPSCLGQGRRTVQLEQLVTLPVGQAVTIEGDGGLSIRLIRSGAR